MIIGSWVGRRSNPNIVGRVIKMKYDRWSSTKGPLVTIQHYPISVGTSIYREPELLEIECDKPGLDAELLEIECEPSSIPEPKKELPSERPTMPELPEAKAQSNTKYWANRDDGITKLSLDAAYSHCAIFCGKPTASELRNKYAKLNVGMQKMNLVNRVRAEILRRERT